MNVASSLDGVVNPLHFVEYRWSPLDGSASDLRDPSTARRVTDFGRIRRYVLERDGGVCHYCSTVAKHVDHVWPRKYGGPDRADNLVAACALCNQTKSDQVRYDLMRPAHWELLLQYESRQLLARAEELERLHLLTIKHLGGVREISSLISDVRTAGERLSLVSERLYLYTATRS